MKCPACGFETPDSQAWCDFCKEPFKGKGSSAAAPPPALPARVEVPAALMAKLLAERGRSEGEPGAGAIPPEFLHLDAGEKVSGFPPIVRQLAWVFLFIVGFWMLVGCLWLLKRGADIRSGRVPPSDLGEGR